MLIGIVWDYNTSQYNMIILFLNFHSPLILHNYSLSVNFRYQREEEIIDAWINLQTSKAEAETKKLEV